MDKSGKSDLIHRGMLGKHHSNQTKEKLRLINLGKKLSKEHKQKLRN